MSVYTKTGDKGETRVFDKKTGELVKLSKNSCKIRAIGAIDELNSYLGIVRLEIEIEFEKDILNIQRNLFTINSILAGGNLRFSKTKTKKLEREIDEWEGKLPVLKNFIIYSGTPKSTQIFYARALCRKAERSVVKLSKEQKISDSILTYINRLSDYLFMLARFENHKSGVKEEIWKG